MKVQKNTRAQRKMRNSMHVRGTEAMPRLSVARSNKHFQAQLINDDKGITLVGVAEVHVKETAKTKTEKAKLLGLFLAAEAKKHKITSVVFDKGAYRYHGRVKAFAEGAREGGLKF